MLTSSETQQLPMYEFCYPNTKIDEFDRTSGTFKEDKIRTSDQEAVEGLLNRAEQAPINKYTKTDIFDCTSGTALTTEAKLASIGFIETIDDNFDETSGTDSEYESSNSDEWSDVALDQGNLL